MAVLFSVSQVYAGEQDGYQKLDVPDKPFVEPMLTGNKIHMHLGLASLIAAGLTGLTAPDSENAAGNTGQSSKNTAHYYLANAAAALGGAAVVSGLILHLDDIEMDALDPDTLHMILGILGTGAYVYAISRAPKVLGGNSNGHATAGIAGAALMATGIYFEW
ncbi:MAG: hypothetical protein Q9M18_00865 [Mariprofundaceae bacterium]|nr:hypothetical protein [Mariprofundaceae bacterium]